MIWLGRESLRHHEWAERLPLTLNRLICMQCRLERPLGTGTRAYPIFCPPRLEDR